MRAFGVVATLASCMILLAGCSSKPPPEAALNLVQLQDVNDILRAATGALKRPPTRISELDRYRDLFPRGHAVIKSGEVVVLWGTALMGESEVGKNETVVAYEKCVPTDGGYVLGSAGSVMRMSAADFNAATKSAKK